MLFRSGFTQLEWFYTAGVSVYTLFPDWMEEDFKFLLLVSISFCLRVLKSDCLLVFAVRALCVFELSMKLLPYLVRRPETLQAFLFTLSCIW